MQKIFSFLIIVSISLNAFAQDSRKDRQEQKREHINNIIKQEEEGVITYKKSFLFGVKLISSGYGAFFEVGRASSVKKAMLYQFEFSELKNVKEQKVNSYYSNSIPYIYGKINYVYPVKLGVQQQMLLGNKLNKNGVAVTANYGGGLSLALLRPYYVQLQDGNGVDYIKYDSKDSLQFLTGKIIGGAGLSKGWNEITVNPGLYAKMAFRFDYGAYNEVISALEVGIAGDYYSKAIPQMVYNSQKNFFFSAYVAILFGKRK
jgi:hypothetical protein